MTQSTRLFPFLSVPPPPPLLCLKLSLLMNIGSNCECRHMNLSAKCVLKCVLMFLAGGCQRNDSAQRAFAASFTAPQQSRCPFWRSTHPPLNAGVPRRTTALSCASWGAAASRLWRRHWGSVARGGHRCTTRWPTFWGGWGTREGLSLFC